MRFSKQNSVIRLKSSISAPPTFLAPPKFLGWLRHCLILHFISGPLDAKK